MCRSKEDAAAALAAVQQWTASAGLTLHPTKTRVLAKHQRRHGDAVIHVGGDVPKSCRLCGQDHAQNQA
jgi:hypothetical protein